MRTIRARRRRLGLQRTGASNPAWSCGPAATAMATAKDLFQEHFRSDVCDEVPASTIALTINKDADLDHLVIPDPRATVDVAEVVASRASACHGARRGSRQPL